MSARDDGGPAFPVIDTSQNTATGETTVYQAVQSGISVRDYFAAKAMQGILSDPAIDHPAEQLATFSYAIADAMLKARAA